MVAATTMMTSLFSLHSSQHVRSSSNDRRLAPPPLAFGQIQPLSLCRSGLTRWLVRSRFAAGGLHRIGSVPTPKQPNLTVSTGDPFHAHTSRGPQQVQERRRAITAREVG
jgi:hypothetical protein